ncbi:MAG: hypothetical protein R3F55_00265 [Alphaproteobacteria bacterium]
MADCMQFADRYSKPAPQIVCSINDILPNKNVVDFGLAVVELPFTFISTIVPNGVCGGRPRPNTMFIKSPDRVINASGRRGGVTTPDGATVPGMFGCAMMIPFGRSADSEDRQH